MVMFHKCIFSHDLACGTMYISRRNWLNCGSDVRLTWKKLGNLDVLHGCPLPVMDRAMAPGYIGIDDISGIYPRATNWGLLNHEIFSPRIQDAPHPPPLALAAACCASLAASMAACVSGSTCGTGAGRKRRAFLRKNLKET